jgi:hypothetical protein
MTAPIDTQITAAARGALARRMVFRDWFGLTPTQSAMLSALFESVGYVAPAILALAVGCASQHVKQRISEIRQAMEAEAIDTMNGAYGLTETGRAECLAALWLVGEELRSAA